MFTRTIAGVRGVLVASQSVIDERGMRRRPSDLKDWPMISVHPFFGSSIRFETRQVTRAKAQGMPRFLTTSILAARGAARAGAGFTLLPEWLAAPEFQAGTLVHLLPAWEPKTQPLSVAIAHRN